MSVTKPVYEELKQINADLRTSATLISLTVIGAFLGARAGNIEDKWYTAPIVFCCVVTLYFTYFSLVHSPLRGIFHIFLILAESICTTFFVGMLIGNFWLAGGLIGSWAFCSLFLQMPERLFEIENND